MEQMFTSVLLFSTLPSKEHLPSSSIVWLSTGHKHLTFELAPDRNGCMKLYESTLLCFLRAIEYMMTL